ncbi:MAG: hypothetical protein K2M31_05590 [Muribaculaceae bacterium]|nr:hypothetical protein [Muribaculaceae bacterium]
MSENSNKNVPADAGMAIYEEIVNSIDSGSGSLDQLICDLKHADPNGQFLCSTARFLSAVDRERYAEYLPTLIEGAIEKDRERRYLGQLLKAIWGDDYAQRVEELCASDDLFRRLHKRAFATGTFD